MPETGNSVPLSKEIWSIRLWRGGLSFFGAAGDNAPASGSVFFRERGFTPAGMSEALDRLPMCDAPCRDVPVRLFIDTHAVVFVPEEVVAVSDPYALLAAAGIECASCEAVVTEAWESVCAVAALPSGIMDVLGERLGADLRLLSPLHEVMAAYRGSGMQPPCFVVYPTQENIYITRYGENGELLVAEAYPCRTAADAVYYLDALVREAGLNCRDVQVGIHGDRPERYAAALKKYFLRARAL